MQRTGPSASSSWSGLERGGLFPVLDCDGLHAGKGDCVDDVIHCAAAAAGQVVDRPR